MPGVFRYAGLEYLNLSELCRLVNGSVFALCYVLDGIESELGKKENLEKFLERFKPVSEKVTDLYKSFWDWDCSLLQYYSIDRHKKSLLEEGGPKQALQDLRDTIETIENVRRGVVDKSKVEGAADFLNDLADYILHVDSTIHPYKELSPIPLLCS